MIATRCLALAIAGALSLCVVPVQKVVGQSTLLPVGYWFPYTPQGSMTEVTVETDSAIEWTLSPTKKFYEARGAAGISLLTAKFYAMTWQILPRATAPKQAPTKTPASSDSRYHVIQLILSDGRDITVFAVEKPTMIRSGYVDTKKLIEVGLKPLNQASSVANHEAYSKFLLKNENKSNLGLVWDARLAAYYPDW